LPLKLIQTRVKPRVTTFWIMEPLNAVFVASEDLVSAWCAHAGRTDVLAFTDADANAAYDAIVKRRPRVLVLEQIVAATSRGAALIDCVRNDSSLGGVEIRLLPPESAAAIASSHAHAPAGALVALAHPMQPRKSRRAVRVRLPEGIEAIVDGRPVQLIDISVLGAQIVSWEVLKPNQRIRVTLEVSTAAPRLQASVAWASYEMPRAMEPHYRAGVEFRDADPATVQNFYARLRG
jgi:PilZ domain